MTDTTELIERAQFIGDIADALSTSYRQGLEDERKRAVAAIHWVFSADGTKTERSMADEAINKINDPTFMPRALKDNPNG